MCLLLAVGAHGVLGDGHAASVAGRVADDELDAPSVRVAALAHPARQGSLAEGEVGADRLEHPCGQLGPLHDPPAHGLEAGAGRGAHEAADPGGGLHGQDHAPLGQLGSGGRTTRATSAATFKGCTHRGEVGGGAAGAVHFSGAGSTRRGRGRPERAEDEPQAEPTEDDLRAALEAEERDDPEE